ncbi:hypothetical protein ICW40_16515 [Actinotalea ferrariae]|uniref:DUF4279 domain-containing protein n=1 Tax=Actinotalea ferrariae TaxID=1386098 RepID=UPI001C8B2DD2|nr:DUF4279 domain-containing protein [Actinotalea ferrariae]MBX9246399.1 hypothetical protein [Actinotalea ferrariae]
MATFRLYGPGPLSVTLAEVLESTPAPAPRTDHRAARLGEQALDRRWSVCSSASGVAEEVELQEALGRVLDRLEPHAAELWRLVDDGYWANWSCYVGSHATEHTVEMGRPLMGRILQLPGDLWLDVYDDYPDE